jgi:hypothetical protein
VPCAWYRQVPGRGRPQRGASAVDRLYVAPCCTLPRTFARPAASARLPSLRLCPTLDAALDADERRVPPCCAQISWCGDGSSMAARVASRPSTPSHFIPSHPIPSHPIPSHPIPSHLIPSHPIASHRIPSHPISSRPTGTCLCHARVSPPSPPSSCAPSVSYTPTTRRRAPTSDAVRDHRSNSAPELAVVLCEAPSSILGGAVASEASASRISQARPPTEPGIVGCARSDGSLCSTRISQLLVGHGGPRRGSNLTIRGPSSMCSPSLAPLPYAHQPYSPVVVWQARSRVAAPSTRRGGMRHTSLDLT